MLIRIKNSYVIFMIMLIRKKYVYVIHQVLIKQLTNGRINMEGTVWKYLHV